MYVRQNFTIVDFYNRYKENIEQDTIYDIDFNTYRAIVFDYFKFIRDQIFDGKEFFLPCRLGTIQIVKHKPKEYSGKSLRYDWKSMREAGKPMYYLNEHSDFFKYRFLWSKKDCLFTNKGKYMFIASRDNKRMLAKIIFSKQHDYTPI